jgi:hypothetical protein
MVVVLDVCVVIVVVVVVDVLLWWWCWWFCWWGRAGWVRLPLMPCDVVWCWPALSRLRLCLQLHPLAVK